MTGSIEDTIATALPPGVWGGEKLLARKIAAVLRAAGVVPAEPATHDTSRWEAHRSYGIRDTLTGGTLWCHDADAAAEDATWD